MSPGPGLLLLVIAVTMGGGCARGCEEPQVVEQPEAPTLPQSGPERVERALGLELPRRTRDRTLPGLGTFPHRVLANWSADRHLVARLGADGLSLLGQRLSDTSWRDEARLAGALRRAAEDWGTRSGTAATRLVLALDRHTLTADAALLRRLAIKSHNWHVVVLARDGDRLVEVLVGPAPARRPVP